MDVKLDVEGKFKEIVDARIKKVEKSFWRELEKLRKRIVELELKNSDINKKFKGTWRNQK